MIMIILLGFSGVEWCWMGWEMEFYDVLWCLDSVGFCGVEQGYKWWEGSPKIPWRRNHDLLALLTKHGIDYFWMTRMGRAGRVQRWRRHTVDNLIWLVVWNIFYFSIYWEYSSQLTNIFQSGKNHQPVIYCISFPTCQVRVSRFYQLNSRCQWALPDLSCELQITEIWRLRLRSGSAHVRENVRRNARYWRIPE